MSAVDLLLSALDQAFDKKSWHGTNLRGALRGLDPMVAAFRPGPGRNTIHELVVHCAYWKCTVRRRLRGEKRGSFPLEGSNFFARPRADAAQLDADVKLLAAEHRELRRAVADLRDDQLGRGADGGKAAVTVQALVQGVAAHDLYHAGQIQLLKRLAEGRPTRQRRT